MYLKDLVGREVANAVKSGEDIVLNLKDGTGIVLSPEGDCCAYCYIQHVNFAEVLTNATIKGVEDLECTSESPGEYEQIDSFGHRIITDKGICTIEMRVEHNGYYGGSLDVSKVEAHKPGKPLEDF